ncbi:MAG: PH domain-containing protein [Terrisporobacter sp.]
MEHEKISKSAIGCMFVATLVQVLITSSVLFIIYQIFKDSLPQIVKIIMMIVVALDIVYLIVSPKVRYERYRYAITEDSIDVKEGFLFITRSIVPIERLHKIAIEKGPIDRAFGLAKVIVTTAGGDVDIRFLEDDKCEFIANSLKKKINEIAIESRTQNNDKL